MENSPLKEASTSKELTWQGLPYRGKATTLKKSDAQPQLDYDVHAKVFHVFNEEDLREYEQVMQESVRGKVRVWVEERHLIQSTGQFIVFVKWGVPFYRPPTEFETMQAMTSAMFFNRDDEG